MTTLNSQKHRNRFTVGALGVVFARVSITFAAPAHADTALVQDRLSRSIQAVASGLTMEISEHRYVGTQQLPIPGTVNTRLILRGNNSDALTAPSSYMFEYTYKAQFSDRKPTTSVRQGIADSTSDGGYWIQRSKIDGLESAGKGSVEIRSPANLRISSTGQRELQRRNFDDMAHRSLPNSIRG